MAVGDGVSVSGVRGNIVLTLGGAVVTVGVGLEASAPAPGSGRNCSAAKPAM
jgi:hypothetical protein